MIDDARDKKILECTRQPMYAVAWRGHQERVHISLDNGIWSNLYVTIRARAQRVWGSSYRIRIVRHADRV